MWIGSPWAKEYFLDILIIFSLSDFLKILIEVTMLPEKTPLLLFLRFDLYIGTILLFRTWSIRKLFFIRSCSKVNEQPIAKATRSLVHKASTLYKDLTCLPFS